MESQVDMSVYGRLRRAWDIAQGEAGKPRIIDLGGDGQYDFVIGDGLHVHTQVDADGAPYSFSMFVTGQSREFTIARPNGPTAAVDTVADAMLRDRHA